jgi:transcriptional activator of cad operon
LLMRVGEWILEPELDRLSRDGREIKLEPRATRLLLHLIARAGHNVTVDELLEHVWPDVVVGPDSVYQAIALLRRKLGDDPQRPGYIAHIPRKGYRLIATVSGSGEAAPAPGEPADGAQGAPAALSDEPRLPVPGRWFGLRAAALALAAIALGLGGAVLVLRSQGHPSTRPPTAAANLRDGGAAPRPAAASIAVLPFLDLSEKQDLAYFADGMVEELIDRLSHATELRVPARTSSFYFKNRAAPVEEIARALNVANVLEGSVRRSGNRVRVTAQLIRAEDGYHLWSESYDRDLGDLLSVEDEIARAVVHALQVHLLAGRGAESALTADHAAHDLLLQCEFYRHRSTAVDADKAVECFRRS